MKRIESRKKLVFKKEVKFFVFAILFFFACISFSFLYTYYHPKEIIIDRYNYKINRNADYKIYLKDNDFYEEKYMASGGQYTAELIDYIDIDFSYLYSGSDLVKGAYSYTIDATIIGEYDNSDSNTKELWKKKYVIKDKTTTNLDNKSSFNIMENVKINYDDYLKVVDDFKNQFRLAITAYLNVKLTINYDGDVTKATKPIKGTDTIEVNIPLSTTTIAIKTKLEPATNEYINLDVENGSHQVTLYVGVGLAIFDLILFILLFDNLFVFNKNIYLKKLQKILKDYSDITIKIDKNINFEDKEVIKISEFNDMLDVEEEFNSPIMVFEKIKNKETWFMIVNEDYIYLYILNIYNVED